jgi:hypothetical protein
MGVPPMGFGSESRKRDSSTGKRPVPRRRRADGHHFLLHPGAQVDRNQGHGDGVGVTVMLKTKSGDFTPLGRWCGAWAAALMLFLTVASACPELHEAFCHHRHEPSAALATSPSAADCVITLFGAGDVLPGTMLAASAPDLAAVLAVPASGEVVRLSTGEWVRPPSCGPPARAV